MITSFYSSLLATIFGSVPPAPSMPVVAPPAPPPFTSPRPVFTVPSEVPASTFEVEVSAGSSRLWSATVRAGNGRAANYRQSLDQAAPDGCAREFGERQVSQRLEVSIQPTGYRPDGDRSDRFMIQATWTRPASPGSCPDLGSRTVQVQRFVALPMGETIEVEGDAGLRIRLRRIG